MKQAIAVAKESIKARLSIPGSKSITNRALLLAALSDGICELFDILISDDTIAFARALHELGVMVQLDEVSRSCIVGGCSGRFPKTEAKVWCENAGTVERFLVAAAASTLGNFSFDGNEQLRKRPIDPLLQVLCSQGASILPKAAKQMPFLLKGIDGLQGGPIMLATEESSQFISALLMISPFAKTPLVIDSSERIRRPFVDMTCKMMAEFGVLVRKLHQGRYTVPVPQRYSARDYWVEPDLTTASYFFAAAAVTQGEVTIQPVVLPESKQGDAKFLSLLEKMGCQIRSTHHGLTLKGPAQLKGINVDMRDCSDTFMTIAAIAPFASSPTTITNIGHTRLQESNRISAMAEELKKLKIKVEEGRDWLKVHPSAPIGREVYAHEDHRIAMSLAIIGLRVGGVEIDGAECVGKTCPEFFEMWSGMLKH